MGIVRRPIPEKVRDQRSSVRWGALGLLIVFFLGCPARVDAAEPPQFAPEDLEFFEKEVRPILVARCYECHSDQAKEPKGGLRLDSRAAMLKGGETGPVIIPGDAQKSLLVDAINYGELYQMPPKTRLPDAEVAVLTKWVARGAPWPGAAPDDVPKSELFDIEARKAAHWCWQPIKKLEPPGVQDSAWPKHDLDRFILAKLEAAGLAPAPPADKRALIRRASFDLIGLPPSPHEVDQFVQDNSPQAFERVVDRLLESTHFGERWARHWMDLVRYAETFGHEFDYPIQHAWRYRDYLIRAFNADVPYDQFIVEHMAGDLLPTPRLNRNDGSNESIVGTGFWFLHEATHAPVDVRGDQAIRIDNQIDVMSKVFLALTISCARCHDHKFDAISTKDYYALAGVLQSSRRQEAMLDADGKIHRAATQVDAVLREVETAVAEVAEMAQRLTAENFALYLLAARAVAYGDPAAGEPIAEPGNRRNLANVAEEFGVDRQQLRAWVEAMADASLDDPMHPLHVWKQLALRPNAALRADFDAWRERTRSEVARAASLAADYNCFADFKDGTYDGWFATGESFGAAPTHSGQWDVEAKGTQLIPPGIAHSGQRGRKFQGVLRSPTFTIKGSSIYYRLAGTGCEVRLIVDGYTMVEFHQLLFNGMKFPIDAKEAYVWHRAAGDLEMYRGHRAYIELIDNGNGWAGIDEIWFSDRDTPPVKISPTAIQMADTEPCESLAELARRFGQRWQATMQRWRTRSLTAEDTELVNWMLRHWACLDGSGERTRERITQICDKARTRITDATENLSAPTRVTAMTDGTGVNEHIYVRGNPRTLGEEVPRQLVTALVGQQPPITRGSGRLILARQIADPANPLTARVMVNRLWHYLFGRGIVASVDNFGVLGEPPSHPELLDFLSQQFVQEGWSVKRLLRTVILSSTYQMSSVADARASEADPTNRLLHATRIRRLDGESIRDAMLAISGRLDPTLFGPSVPVNITPFMQGRGRPASSGPLDGEGRRSIYTEVRRNFLSPLMLAFDTPIPFNPVGRRNVSNVPAQALILMNDPFVVEQAKRWSGKLLEDSRLTYSERVQRAYVAAFARPPTDSELAQAKAFFAIQGEALGIPLEQSELDGRVWSDFCHVLWNVKEFVFIN